MKSNRGEATLIILGTLLLLGIGGMWAKNKYFHGDTKRAKTSVETTDALVAAGDGQKEKAAAVFAKIGETNAEAPDSPQKKVISRFVPIGLSFTGQPDPAFMLELEKLKVALLTGKLEQADKLNGALLQDAEAAKLAYAKAVADKRASDAELERVAAERRSAEEQRFWAFLIAGAVLALYVWTKITHVSPWALARSVADMRNGTTEPNQAIAAIDTATSPTQQMAVRANAWVQGKLTKIFS